MKFYKPDVLDIFIITYLFALLAIIWICPNYFNNLNGLWLIPLYVLIVISRHRKHKNDECANNFVWSTRWLLIAVTAIIVIFNEIVDYLK